MDSGSYLLGSVTAIIAWVVLSAAVANFAKTKGHSAFGAFLLSIFLSPLVALLVTACNKPDEGELIKSGKVKKCPFCAELIKRQASICHHCGRDTTGFFKVKKSGKLLKGDFDADAICDLINRGELTLYDCYLDYPSNSWRYLREHPQILREETPSLE